jgi:hypothetical protein
MLRAFKVAVCGCGQTHVQSEEAAAAQTERVCKGAY